VASSFSLTIIKGESNATVMSIDPAIDGTADINEGEYLVWHGQIIVGNVVVWVKTRDINGGEWTWIYDLRNQPRDGETLTRGEALMLSWTTRSFIVDETTGELKDWQGNPPGDTPPPKPPETRYPYEPDIIKGEGWIALAIALVMVGGILLALWWRGRASP